MYPDHEVYRKLYANYLDRRPAAELVDLVDVDDGVVVDLCCGEGEITKLCLDRGADKVYMVDSEPRMIDVEYFRQGGYRVEILTMEVAIYLWNYCRSGLPPFADVVFCRQAVNYWFASEMADNLPCIIKPGGRFIFNTFNRKPSEKPTIKEYLHDGSHFVEVSWLVPNQGGSGIDFVHHVQIRDRMESHTTRFAWISPVEFHTRLREMGFSIKESVDGGASIYVCTREK